MDPALLAQPMVDLLQGFGTGLLAGGAEIDPAAGLRASSVAVDAVHGLGQSAVAALGTSWSGAAADAAIAKAAAAQQTAAQIADRGNALAAVMQRAAADVQAGNAELEGILQSFLAIAAAAGPALLTPPGELMILSAAIEHLNRALAVVARVRGQLATHTSEITALPQIDTPAPAEATAPAATAPASAQPFRAVADAATRFGHAFAESAAQPVGAFASGGRSSLYSSPRGRIAAPPDRTPRGAGPGEHRLNGEGIQVTLPDGSTATAPNERAAAAVRAALSQQGVPYVWGGTTPGQGLDCSGLTQYAYHEAGVDLPRLAQEQGAGHTQIDPRDVMPGDLAVWDGHVAMVIGNGQLVEAGDPVQVGPIRTENLGMDFYGFFRPTE
ncbi:C40 family peptidase [Skermania sp. ID1734]|uniref:C40 family peptidase n=1 Tax=Skermania sp. ID1734 TaxID=2597516 RepID=UPI00351BA194